MIPNSEPKEMINKTIHSRRFVDALINAARKHPTESIRDQLIEIGVDANNRYIGFHLAYAYWHKAIKTPYLTHETQFLM